MNWHCIFKNIKNREFRLRDLITPMSSILVVNLGKAFPKTGRAIERKANILSRKSLYSMSAVSFGDWCARETATQESTYKYSIKSNKQQTTSTRVP